MVLGGLGGLSLGLCELFEGVLLGLGELGSPIVVGGPVRLWSSLGSCFNGESPKKGWAGVCVPMGPVFFPGALLDLGGYGEFPLRLEFLLALGDFGGAEGVEWRLRGPGGM